MLKLLIDGDVYAPGHLGRRHLLVGGGRVLWIGNARPEVPASFPVEVTDLGGLRVIPGLVDCHVHLTGGGGEGGFPTRVPPLSLGAFTGSGTTTVVGVLGTDDTTRDTELLVAAARGLTAEGITAYCLTGGYHVPPVTLTGSVRGDVVHVDRILGVGELAISDHRSSQPTLSEVLRIASDAYVGGMLAGKAGVTHLHLGDGPRGLELVRDALEQSELPARVFHPTHVNRRRGLFEEACALAERGVPIDITAFPTENGEDEWSAPEALARYIANGLPADRVTISSDAGGSLPVFDAEGRLVRMDVGSPAALVGALRETVAAGVELASALPAFTSNPAEVFGLSSKGRIRAGADADLVTLTDTGEVRDVMARGRWHVRDGNAVVLGTYEQTGSKAE